MITINTFPEAIYDATLGEYVAILPDGHEVFGATRADCNDAVLEAMRVHGKHSRCNDLSEEAAPDCRASLSTGGAGGASSPPQSPRAISGYRCRECGSDQVRVRDDRVDAGTLEEYAACLDCGFHDTLGEFEYIEKAPAKALRDCTPEEIMAMTPGQFALSHLADGCMDCSSGPRYACQSRGRCDEETFGRG